MAAPQRNNTTGTLAVVGDSPFAAVLAALLALDHRRAVTLVAAPATPLRLPRGPAYSIAPLLRPESWRLALDTTPEALHHIGRINKRAAGRTDMLFAARGQAQAYALEHVRHLADGYGQPTEPVVPAPAGFDTAYRVRDVHRLYEAAFWNGVPGWLARAGVTVVPSGTTLAVYRDGSGRVGGSAVDHVIFADDAAILAHCAPREIEPIARRVPMTAFRTEVMSGRPEPAVVSLGGAFAHAQTRELTLDIVAAGAPGAAARAAAHHLSDPIATRIAGRSHFTTLVPRDGAPVIGRLRHTRATVLFGLGAQAVFLAPALARFIAGTPGPREETWCEARRPTRDFTASRVAEYVPAPVESAA